MTAQRLADEMKDAAQNEAKMIVREAQGRADLLLQKAQARLEEIERDINELRLRRRGVEGSLEASIQTLYHALEFIREQDHPEEKVLLHRPRQAESTAQLSAWRRLAPRMSGGQPATLLVRVIPRSARTAIAGKRGDALLVRLAAPPVDGAANDALIEFLAGSARSPSPRHLHRLRRVSRDKRIEIAGSDADQLAERLPRSSRDA